MLAGKLSSDVISERQQLLNSMKRFVQEQKEKFQQVLQRLNLTEQSLSQVEAKKRCPFDKSHLVPEDKYKMHVEKCRLLKAGYQEDELPLLLQNYDFCYEGSNTMKIDIDESLLNKIIWDECAQTGQVYTGHRAMPVSYIDEAVGLSQCDRLAVYSHVVTQSHQAGKVIPVDRSDELLTTDWGSLVRKGLLNEQDNQQYTSKLEQLAALRDMKRRRQSYRAKNVHITKKSYTEIIREVIVNQMEILAPQGNSKSVSEDNIKNTDRKRKHQDRGNSKDRDQLDSRGKDGENTRERDRDDRGKDGEINRERDRDDRGKDGEINRERDRDDRGKDGEISRERDRDDRRERDKDDSRDWDRDDRRERNRDDERRDRDNDRRERDRDDDKRERDIYDRRDRNKDDSRETKSRHRRERSKDCHLKRKRSKETYSSDKSFRREDDNKYGRFGDDNLTTHDKPGESLVEVKKEIDSQSQFSAPSSTKEHFSLDKGSGNGHSPVDKKWTDTDSQSSSKDGHRTKSRHKKSKHKKKHKKKTKNR